MPLRQQFAETLRTEPAACQAAGVNHALPAMPATDVVAGRYALCDPIDSGGSGTVWRAWDLALSRYCAAKLLRRRDAGQLLRFVREQAVRLEGDHIASPYAWAAEESDVLIATELIDGGSLHQLVAAVGPLSESTVAALLDQLLAGLQQVHAAGLVHRDVKPGNVLLRATGTGPPRALLIDFGLAIRADDARLTELGMVIGTPGYLPPELADGSGPSSAQDLYAAGRAAVALLTAQEPTIGVPQHYSIHDPSLRQTVTALLQTDPARRPPTAAIARGVLSPARRDPAPRTRSGSIISIGPRLPPLPDGWDPLRGPTSNARVTPAKDAVAPKPRAATVMDGGFPSSSAAPGAGAVLGSQQLVSAPRRPSRWPWFVGGFGVLLALAAIITAVIAQGGRRPVAPSTGSPITGNSGVATSSATTSPGSAVVGPKAGEECSWVDEGASLAGPGGTVICRLTVDGRYLWDAA